MTKKLNLTEGPIFGNLIRFSLPLIFTNILQAVYNVADMAIAGHFTDPEGMTAINTSGQIAMIILMIIIGFSNGTNIVTGQMVGAGRSNEIRAVVKTTLPLFGLLAIVISIVVAAIHHPLLILLNVPAEAFEQARSYLLICLCGTIFIYLYNTLAAILRGLGDSYHPMLFMVISTVVNIVLDFVFMGPLHLGISGAALATVCAQALSMCMIFVYFIKETTYLTKDCLRFQIHPKILKMIIKIGLPQACQFSATQISLLLIAGMVNAYGVVAAAAVGASNKAGTFAQLPGQALNAGVLTTTAQNLPKGNYKRILRSMFCAMGLGMGIAAVFLVFALLCPERILGIFTTNMDVVAVGTFYLAILSFSFVIENIIYTSTGVVSGAGYTPITMTAAMLAAAGRIGFAILFQHTTDLGLYSICAAALIAPFIPILIMILVLLSGKWKTSRIQKELTT